ncbi:hypothetical protein GQ600_17109 [Phytophthora cactorum]|nr:hypothetical protein GQ600_17109 [Phytophthora cactorum]
MLWVSTGTSLKDASPYPDERPTKFTQCWMKHLENRLYPGEASDFSQNQCRKHNNSGAPMSSFLRKDLMWWNELVFQNEFAGLPMELFRRTPDGKGIATALTKVTSTWGPNLTTPGTWCRIIIHDSLWISDLVDKKNCKSASGQHDLRHMPLSQARYRLHFATHTFGRRMDQTSKCDVHSRNTNSCGMKQVHCRSGVWRKNETSSSSRQSQPGHLGNTAKTSSFANRSVTISDFPCGSTTCPGQGKRGWLDYSPHCALQKGTTGLVEETSSRFSTERWQRWHSHTRSFGTPGSITIITELEIVAKGYKRTLDRKQPAITPMLLEMRRLLGKTDQQNEMMWESIVRGFFFLDRSSELWGPVTVNRSTGTDNVHYVRAVNVILRDRHGRQVGPEAPGAVSEEMIFDSHKGERTAQGVTIRHSKSDNSAL